MSNEEHPKPNEPNGTGESRKANQTGTQSSVMRSISDLLRPLAISRFRIIDLADSEQTIAGIKKDIEFRGFNLWILVFSIVICSIGLNVDSAAVVIGAMLISPLMGPIMAWAPSHKKLNFRKGTSIWKRR